MEDNLLEHIHSFIVFLELLCVTNTQRLCILGLVEQCTWLAMFAQLLHQNCTHLVVQGHDQILDNCLWNAVSHKIADVVKVGRNQQI